MNHRFLGGLKFMRVNITKSWFVFLGTCLVSGCLVEAPEITNPEPLGCDSNTDCINGMTCTIEGFCKEGTAMCGDGVVDTEFGETCDDGNDHLNDSCPSGPSGTSNLQHAGTGLSGIQMGESRPVSLNQRRP